MVIIVSAYVKNMLHFIDFAIVLRLCHQFLIFILVNVFVLSFC